MSTSDGSKTLMEVNRQTNSKVTKLFNHISDLETRISRLEKLVILAIGTNLPQLIQIFIDLI